MIASAPVDGSNPQGTWLPTIKIARKNAQISVGLVAIIKNLFSKVKHSVGNEYFQIWGNQFPLGNNRFFNNFARVQIIWKALSRKCDVLKQTLHDGAYTS